MILHGRDIPRVRLNGFVIDPTPDALMKAVVDRYLKSPDFNGLHIHGDIDPALIAVARDLVHNGRVQVIVSEVDYPNPHIRPWPSRRTIESQGLDPATAWSYTRLHSR